MAAIARSVFLCSLLAAVALGANTPRQQVSHVASALTAREPADAMTSFEKSFADYDKLRGYFGGLTAAFEVTNRLEVTEEQDSEQEATINVEWALHLANAENGFSQNRKETVHIRLVLKKGQWKIVEFSPVEFFNPQGYTPR
jgi:hypothetical protein